MKNLINLGLVLVCVSALSGCKKKEEPPVVVVPPVVEEPQSAMKQKLEAAKAKVSDFKETAAEKAGDLKESAGGMIDKATVTVKDFGSKAGDVIQKVKPDGE